MEKKSVFSMLSRSQLIGIAVMASAVTVAGAVSLTSFTPGTTISASAVNANFQALNNALPLVWASTRGGLWRHVLDNPNSTPLPHVLDTLRISVPADGHLILAGTVYVKNNRSSTTLYELEVLIDGREFDLYPFVARAKLLPSGNADDATLAYTVTVPILGGAHTITQQIVSLNPATDELVSATFAINRNSLTATFVPAIAGYNLP
jgi:hypothetical protein